MSYILDTKSRPQHTTLRGDTYYFQMRVPRSQQQLYGSMVRVRLTACPEEARAVASHLSKMLKQAWASDSQVKVCVESVVQSFRSTKTTFSSLAEEYIQLRQIDSKSAKVAIRSLLAVAGDRDIGTYTRDDARALLLYLKEAGNKTATIRRRFVTINAIINYAYYEFELEGRNPFARMQIIGEGEDASRRGTYTADQLAAGYQEALMSGSEVRLLFPILGETGCRLAEIVGLRVEDVDLHERVLHIRPNAKRRLKTACSERTLPLTQVAYLALHKAVDLSDAEWVFPRYIKEDGCYATHASNALAKWTKSRWGLTAHSLRHTFRDRLRAAEVPIEAIDQLGGWSSVGGVGTRYGRGYAVEHLSRFIERISI